MHVTPAEIGRPWVVLGGDRAWKAYPISYLDADILSRARREADIALDVASLPGVLGAEHVEETGGWLVIEMQRMESTLGAHLEAAEAGVETRLPPEEYARLLAAVGERLTVLHRRGIVHRDIKPQNLLFTADRSQLLIADFSVARRSRRPAETAPGEVLGTDHYLAPEQTRDGTVSAASDQYSLGIVAADIFTSPGAPPLPRPLGDALRVATSANPADRYPGLEGAREFGAALLRAVHAELPRTLSDRLRDVSVQWRFAWAAAPTGALATWIAIAHERRQDYVVGLETLVLPGLIGVLFSAVVYLTNAPRGRRTQSGWRGLDQWWPPWIVYGALIAVQHGTASGWTLWGFLAIPVGVALAGSYPPRCGYWLPGLLDTVERAAGRWRPLRALRVGWLQFAAAVMTVVVCAFLPQWVAHAFPKGFDGYHGDDSGALRQVALLRVNLGRGKLDDACAAVDTTTKGGAPCQQWAPVASRLLRSSTAEAQRAAKGSPLFDFTPLSRIDLVPLPPGEDKSSQYSLATAANRPINDLPTYGLFAVRGNDATVSIALGPARRAIVTRKEANWTYTLHRANERQDWLVREVTYCTAGRPAVDAVSTARCLALTALTTEQIARLMR